MSLAENRKRARSDEEKQARRAAILDAARALIDESGFDGVTMAELAARAGVSKGTLYLYVRTKEEVFLALFVAAIATVTDRIEAEATRDTLIEVMTRATRDEPLYVPLLARLATMIEANVSDEPLFEAKHELWALGARTAAKIAAIYDIPMEQAGEIAQALMIAMQGAAHADISSHRDPATVPEDLRPLMAMQAYDQRFPATARLILASVDTRD
ncbi:MAG: TetR/AcrR family transcriptional regulator [Pseudomonadota bacterium]|nr:TetR/AcrR family transcriptional regulator [Pseudomonadota bacterium]